MSASKEEIAEGIALLTGALSKGSIGAYQLQAAITALHDEAARAEDSDWPQILALYDLLRRMSDNPMVMLNHAIAAEMVHGSSLGLDLLNALDADGRLTGHHWLDAVLICWNGRRPSGRHCTLPDCRRSDDEPTGAELPHRPSRPGIGRFTVLIRGTLKGASKS